MKQQIKQQETSQFCTFCVFRKTRKNMDLMNQDFNDFTEQRAFSVFVLGFHQFNGEVRAELSF